VDGGMPVVEEIDDEELKRYEEICRDYTLKKGADSNLSNILSSLNKLTDLEKAKTSS
jgi:hypothetical protein